MSAKLLFKNTRLGLGCASFGNCFGNVEKEETMQMVKYCLEKGLNYFDTSYWYGQGVSEKVLGTALQNYPREKFIVSTKVGRYDKNVDGMFDFSGRKVMKSVDQSLIRLGLEYVDIVFAHDVEFSPSIDLLINETLPAFQQLKLANKTKYIGISGYPLHYLREIIEKSNVDCDFILTYSRYTLFDDSLKDYFEFFKSKNIGIICASPTGMGLLTSHGPPSWHCASLELRESCKKAAEYCKENNLNISKLAHKFVYENKNIDIVLTGAKSLNELEENFSASLETLTPTERAVIDEIRLKFFPDTRSNHWEGIEVSKYRNKLLKK